MVRIVAIEGNIGSGKSTVVRDLKTRLQDDKKFVFLQEPVDVWETIKDETTGENMIVKFYKDQKKYSFAFQMMAYISRLSILRNMVKHLTKIELEEMNYSESKTCNEHIIICERSLFTDKNVFAKML